MKLEKIYEFFIAQGIAADPRHRKHIQQELRNQQAQFKALSSRIKKFFDKEDLHNPYADTRILFGDRNREIRRILVGIDIEVGEILLANQLTQSGQKIDLILAHHPEGIALAGLDQVMSLQTQMLKDLGIQDKIAKDVMDKRIAEVSRRLHSGNHSRSVDAARLLNIPLMCCHTPSDNHVSQYLQNLMDSKKPKTLQAIVDLLLKEPEYQEAAYFKAGPKILVGKPTDAAGKVLVDMTGGTEGSKAVFARLSQLGIQTQLSMHLSDAHYERIKAEYIQVVNAGHIASDNLGMNLLLDKLTRKADIEIIDCSGFRRFPRHGAHS